MGLIVNTLNRDADLTGKLRHWLKFGYLRPEQGIALLVGLEADDKSLKITSEWGKRQSVDNTLLGVGIALLNGDVIKLTPSPNSVIEKICHDNAETMFEEDFEDFTFEDLDSQAYESSEDELYLSAASMEAEVAYFAEYAADAQYEWFVKSPYDLRDSRELFYDRVRKYKLLVQYWESDKYKHQPEKNHNLWYFMEWAKSKGHNPEWGALFAHLEANTEISSITSDSRVEPDLVISVKSNVNDEPPGKMPRCAIGKLAIKAAWQIECETKRKATPNEVIEKLQAWAIGGEDGYLRDKIPLGVTWRPKRSDIDKKFEIEACSKALDVWELSRA
jgi:hypothetical protein